MQMSPLFASLRAFISTGPPGRSISRQRLNRPANGSPGILLFRGYHGDAIIVCHHVLERAAFPAVEWLVGVTHDNLLVVLSVRLEDKLDTLPECVDLDTLDILDHLQWAAEGCCKLADCGC